MHFLQSKYWKECKKVLGNETLDVENYFFHTTKLPLFNKKIGYMPRPDLNSLNFEELYQKAKEANCVYVTIDPVNLKENTHYSPLSRAVAVGKGVFEKGNPIHLQENTIIDLTKSDEKLLANMKQKHRYNLNLAKKKGVEVKISDSTEALNEFMELYLKTINRQGYHGRSEKYVRAVWDTLMGFKVRENKSLATIATAYFEAKPLASWFLFLYEDTIYYPYGGSSDENKNVMAPYALVWEIIQWGKQNGYKYFDLWGIKSEEKIQDANSETVYDGYSRFKVGFGGEIIEYADTIDFVIDKTLYSILKKMVMLRNKILFKN